ncbi:MAG: glycerol kinase, partial [Geminicoccaceae bacterium]|nr:glycerol kinase [Geminicoccaceae bacterium]
DLEAAGLPPARGRLRVDGGMVANDWFCQDLADILDRSVDRPAVTETTALGAACLAGLAVGLYPSLEAIAEHWKLERRFAPAIDADRRAARIAAWRAALDRVRSTPRG